MRKKIRVRDCLKSKDFWMALPAIAAWGFLYFAFLVITGK